jgi:hypothetical protein
MELVGPENAHIRNYFKRKCFKDLAASSALAEGAEHCRCGGNHRRGDKLAQTRSPGRFAQNLL